MLGHISLGVRDLTASGAFYDALLEPLGVVRLWDSPRGLGYGFPAGGEKLNLFPQETGPLAAGPGFHLAFDAPNRSAVDEAFAGALVNGGRNEGPPGPRSYSDTYYAAFVRDPDGHKLEVVHQ